MQVITDAYVKLAVLERCFEKRLDNLYLEPLENALQNFVNKIERKKNSEGILEKIQNFGYYGSRVGGWESSIR